MPLCVSEIPVPALMFACSSKFKCLNSKACTQIKHPKLRGGFTKMISYSSFYADHGRTISWSTGKIMGYHLRIELHSPIPYQ